MSALSATQRDELRRMFGPWVSFDKQERRLYSHDVGVVPKLIKPIVGNAIADAVVQPEDEHQLIELVHWANANRVHLVPRAKGTSGYGGLMPVKGGITVSMTRMDRVLEIDSEAGAVRVEPGVVWNDLEATVNREGLSLRNYPSSAPSSTVGGWLAQGGVGYGSFEYGCFRDSVLSARLVLPSGEVRVLNGQNLDLVSEAEGITGFITQITVRLRGHQPQQVRAVRFTTAAALADGLNGILEREVPLWSVSFVNPTMARLKNSLPARLEHGRPLDEPRPILPDDGYIMLLAAPASRWAAIEGTLSEILPAHGAEHLDDELAQHEWDERFDLMHIKRHGPSLLPAEVVVPLKNLGPALAEIEKAIDQPLTLEGMVQVELDGDGMVTLLGFIPHDERTLGYSIAYGLALTLVKIAKKHGGRPYSTGFYFAREADAVLGPDRVRRLREFKRSVDPRSIMNPRKVIDSSLTAKLLAAVMPFEPLVRVAGNLFKSPLGERLQGQGRRGVPDDVAWYAYACAQCGYCVDQCPQYYGRGWESDSPRGKWYFLREYMEGRAEMTQAWVNKFLACTTCEMCNVKCPLELPIEPSWQQMRGTLVQEQGRMTFPPFEVMRASARKNLNIWGAERERRDQWLPEELKHKLPEKAETAYFVGCTASLVEQDIAQATAMLLAKSGIEFTYLGKDEACCGLPILCSGNWDQFVQILRHNVEAMQAKGVRKVVTSCPACWLSWKHYYPQWAEKAGVAFHIETYHYSELLTEQIDKGEFEFTHAVPKTVTWHDSCHIGRAGGIYEPPRKLLAAIPGVELEEMAFNREEAHCCGSVLSLLDSPDGAALNIGSRRWQEALDTGADTLVALCPCCEVQLRVTARKKGIEVPVVDLAHIAAEGIGLELADPTEYALEQWSMFEAMIKLLKPEAMAEFMAGLLPQMIEVMPQPWKGVMKWTQATSPAKREAMLGVMRPMMPALFPRLLPSMMPRLMPDMLRAMEEVVPMSDEVQKQMPELMPVVMGNLMPKMLPLVLPHLIPKLEAYLKERDRPLPKAA